MDNLRCTELLADSPSTSDTVNNSTISMNQRRRMAKLTSEQNRSTTNARRLVLGQFPANRKRPAPAEKLNTSQHPSVLSLPDKTVHQDIRSLDGLFNAQTNNAVRGNYFVSVQTNITPKHRQQAIEWLYDVCKEEYSEPDVFPLAVSYIDRFLNVQNIYRENLQALAGACLFISSKVKAPQPISAKRIAYYTDGGVQQQEILSWELLVLSKLNWNVSTATALDFLDQVAARYNSLHPLGEACRISLHRIQLEEKFAFLVPSMQAAICLLFAAAQSNSQSILSSAEHALFNVLRCDSKLLYGYMEAVEKIIKGSHGRGEEEKDTSPAALVAPPSSGTYRSPALTPPVVPAPLAAVPSSLMSNYTSPEQHSRASDDSGFNSGFSSPAAAFDFKGHGQYRDPCMAARRQAKRISQPRLATIHKNLEHSDSGVITTFYASEQDFLQY